MTVIYVTGSDGYCPGTLQPEVWPALLKHQSTTCFEQVCLAVITRAAAAIASAAANSVPADTSACGPRVTFMLPHTPHFGCALRQVSVPGLLFG
jgi:hypothetical protein